MRPVLPDGSAGLFRAGRRVKRSDIVLVDHPEHGLLVRKVATVSLQGRVWLQSMAHCPRSPGKLPSIEPDRVVGRLALKLRWVRFLPRLPGDQ